MENEKKEESIFEQENYQGGFGSGPFAVAADDEDEKQDDASDESETDDEDAVDPDA